MILQRKLSTISKEDVPLLNYAKNDTSQGGEDGILGEIFRRLTLSALLRPDNSFCVDVGAWDGKHLSNTYTLLTEHNWAGLLVEANAGRFQELQALYDSRRADITSINALADIYGDSSLKAILDANHVPKDLAFLSIDIDGADYHLWKSIADDYHPMVVCIEFNPSIPHDILFIQPPVCSIQQGSSLLAMKELGLQFGYLIAAVTQFNAISIRQDLIQQSESIQEIMPVSQQLSSLHRPDMSTAIFQTYDGQLHLAGVQKLLWHRVGINIQQMQPLPKSQRHFPFAPPSSSSCTTVSSKASLATLSWKELIELMLWQPPQAEEAWRHLQSQAMTLLQAAPPPPDPSKLLDICHFILYHPNCNLRSLSSVQKQAYRQLLQFALLILSVIKDSSDHCLHMYVDATFKEAKLLQKEDDCALAAWMLLQKLRPLVVEWSVGFQGSKQKMKWLKLMQECEASLQMNEVSQGEQKRSGETVAASVAIKAAAAVAMDTKEDDNDNGEHEQESLVDS